MNTDLMQLVKIPLVVAVVVILQIVKTLLANRGIKFKNEDNWIWIVLALGLPMALISQGIDGFPSFSWSFVFSLIVNVFVYAASAAFAYKLYKVGGKPIGELFKKGGEKDDAGI